MIRQKREAWLALALSGLASSTSPAFAAPRVGDVYEIAMVRESTEQGTDGSSGNSHDQDTISERVLAIRPDGLELEYDLPKDATQEDRQSSWQFPARVFRPHRGPAQLLNRSELEARVDPWLKKAGWSRGVCGHWIFTWNGFQIECDPQAVIKLIEAFDVTVPDLRDGAAYQEAGTLGSAPLTRKAAGPERATFSAQLKVDPDAVRKAEAETDVAVGEITRKPVTLEAALRSRGREVVSGTVAVTFDADPTGYVRGKTKITQLEIKDSKGRSETRTVTQTIDRKLIFSANR
jgi:hypothetical protein